MSFRVGIAQATYYKTPAAVMINTPFDDSMVSRGKRATRA